MSRSLRAARTFLRRGRLAVEAALFLSFASVATRVLRSSRTTRLLGEPAEVAPTVAGRPAAEALLVGRAVARVARWLPWRPTCLPQALAARAMLARRGIDCVSHVGVMRTRTFEAHAWVTVNGAVVQGGPVGQITELARFT